MLKIKNKIEFSAIFKYLALFLIFIIFNNVLPNFSICSFAIFSSAIALSSSLLLTPIVFLCSFLVVGETGLILSACFPCVILPIISLIYKKYSVSQKYETVLYTALSLTLYIIIGNTQTKSDIIERIIESSIVVFISLFCFTTGRAVSEKGLKYKFGYEETASFFVVIVLFGLGICSTFSPLVFKCLSIFLILLIAFLFRKGVCTLYSSILGIVYAIYFSNITFISLFLLLGIFAEVVMSFSRYVASVIILPIEYASQLIFKIYPNFGIDEIIFSLVGIILFIAIPTKVLFGLKDTLYSYREKQLVRQTINRSRTMLSNKLYELSAVFAEIGESFFNFQKEKKPEENLKAMLQQEVKDNVCFNCEYFRHCNAIISDNNEDFFTLVDIGIAKGKLSLIDMPKNLSRNCAKPSSVLFSLNKLLLENKSFSQDNASSVEGRIIMAQESIAVSEILKNLAYETGSLLKYKNRTERLISKALLKNGVRISEILIYGEGDSITVCMVLGSKAFPKDKILSVLKSALNYEMELTEKAQIAEDKIYLVYNKSADYDAVFGTSRQIKENSASSGDTYSVTRLSNDKFLLALSDGMGSGEFAKNLSSISLALIESLYKADLPNELILNTVNRLLAMNSNDTFTALDVAVINLTNCSVDFIKYGAPYCFIINESGIKIVESNSLPLGILKEISPSVCHTKLEDNDMILFLSDGITDAFTSSSDVVNFLRSVPALNPQSLTDSIINRALELNGLEKKDDMTALAVRIFRRAK